MEERIRLIDTLGDYTIEEADTIFKALYTNDTKRELAFLTLDNFGFYDYEYYYNKSGFKYISPYFETLIEKYELLNAVSSIAVNLILKFKDKWNKIYNALLIDYTPTDDYNMQRIKEGGSTQNETTNRTLERNGTENETKDTTFNRTDETTQNNNENNQVFGFNSTDAVDSDKTIGNTTNNRNVNDTQNDTIQNETTRNDTENGSRDADNKYNSTETIKGKSNESSYQKMIEDELELRKNIFIETVYEDIDSLLVLRIY